MTLIVGTTPYSQWRVLTPLLVHLGWENTDETDPETWYQHAEVSQDSIHLLLHTRPEIAVAHAIDAGHDPQDTLEAWRSAAEQMLAFYKRNRATTAMVEVFSAVQHPQACVRVLKQQLDIKLQGELPKLSQGQHLSANHVKAQQLIARSPELSSLLAEVEACTLPLSADGFRSLRVEILELYKQLREARPEQAQQLQEDCERQVAAMTQLEEDLEREQREHLATKSALEETREENDLILKQLFKVQEELERISAERHRLQAQVNRFQNRLAQLCGSVSWKLKVPARLLAKLFGKSNRGRFKKEAKLIVQSEFFDANWYLTQYPDVAQSKLRPADHYVRYGASEHRDPSSKFSTEQYLEAYEDVAHSGMNPLVHYLRFGKAEGRSPMPASK